MYLCDILNLNEKLFRDEWVNIFVDNMYKEQVRNDRKHIFDTYANYILANITSGKYELNLFLLSNGER